MLSGARRWTGEPQVREKDRCVRWDSYPADALPEAAVAYTRHPDSTHLRGHQSLPRRARGPPFWRTTGI
ncbi:hypothetical protein SNL152K_8991 [Streptomyces sp. NL15-2K]|nr:hypothetical protein SNL152K_8991 [Streptomyces sp. NL15-2K]